MNNSGISISKVSDLPLAALALSKFRAKLLGASVERGNRVIFTLELNGVTLNKVSEDFEADGQVVARFFSQEIGRLRGVVRRALTEGGVR